MRIINYKEYDRLTKCEKDSFTGAVSNLTNDIFYLQNGLYHRSNDLPAKIWHTFKRKEYWFYGDLHRHNNPAIHSENECIYYLYGKCHRLDGPSYIDKRNGDTLYCLYGKRITKEKQEFLYSVYLESKRDYFDILKFEGFICKK